MERNVVEFLDACVKVRSEKGALKVLETWEASLASQAWWQGASVGSPGARIARMLQHHANAYLSAKVTETRAAAKAAKAGKAGKSVEDAESSKPVRVYLGREADGSKPDASFDTGEQAERWALRKVADFMGETFAVVHDTRFTKDPFTRIDKDRATFMVYGRREAPGGVKVKTTGGSGPWMKASQDRSSFSRG